MATKELALEVVVTTIGTDDYLQVTIGTDVRRIKITDVADILKLFHYIYGGTINTDDLLTPDVDHIFFVPTENGIYPNFGNLEKKTNEVAFFRYASGVWYKDTLSEFDHSDLGNRNAPGAHESSAISHGAATVEEKINDIDNALNIFKVGDSFSAENKTLQNLADPINDQDAANKRWTLLQTSGNGSPKGVAYLTTNPIASPVAGDWYFTAENGDYTNFGVIGATAGGRLIYDGTNWVFVVSNEPYMPFPETDPETVTPPASGYFVGTWDGRIWIMGTDGKAKYQSMLSDFESQSQANGIENNFRSEILNDGGTYYANSGAAEIAKLVREDLYKKVSLILTAAAAKAGTGIGDGVLYTIKGSNLAVARNCKASRVDQDGYIRFVNLDEIRIDYSDGKAKILLEEQSTNKILYPFAAENSYLTKTGLRIELDPSTATGVNVITTVSSLGTGWTDNGDGTYTKTAGTGSALSFNTNNAVGKSYYTTFTVSGMTGGYIAVSMGGYSPSIQITANGDYVLYTDTATPSSDTLFYISADGIFDGTISNLSAKEVQGFASPFKDTAGNVLLKARKLVESSDASATSHLIYKNNIAMADGTNSLSIVAKAGERDWVFLWDTESGDGYYFDIKNGVVGSAYGSPKGYEIEELADGYYKVSITVETTTSKVDFQVYTANGGNVGDHSYIGDGTSGIYLAGEQLKEGDPTSLINNPEDLEGSEVTRLKDYAYNNITDWVSILENGYSPTLFTEFDVDYSGQKVWGFCSIGDGAVAGGANGFGLSLYNNLIYFDLATDNGVNNSSTPITVGHHKVALKFDKSANMLKLFVDGSLVKTISVANAPNYSTISNKFMVYSNHASNDSIVQYVNEFHSNLSDEGAIELTK